MVCKTRRGILFIFLLAISLNTIFTGCKVQRENNNEISKAKENKGITIGFSMDTLITERWQRDRDIFVARAKELGADVIVQNANNDSDEQSNQVKYLLEQGIDILVIIPHDAEASTAMVQAAKKQGIKVMAYDRLVRNASVDMYISFDNVRVGEMMAESAVKAVPSGNYVILNGSKSDNNCSMFNSGYKKVLNPLIEKRQVNIIKEVWAKDWRPEEAFKCIEGVLQEGQRIDAVIAANDDLAGGTVEALSERRLAGKVKVVGHDADLNGCERVVEGTQLMTVYKPINKIAKTAAEIAVRMVKGEKVEANSSIYDGKAEVPYYVIQPIAVTKGNMVETIINDGFHRIEEVYRNIPKNEWPSN